MKHPDARSFVVGLCAHGYRAYVLSGRVIRHPLWHSGPPTQRGSVERAAREDGLVLTPCEAKPPDA